MTLNLSEVQKSLLRQAVLVTGPPRSGTTILGKVVSSLKGLEYHFEPPTLRMICSAYAARDLSKEAAANLLVIYLAEDLLLESAHGRRVNLRPMDDSHILNQLEQDALDARWQNVSNRADAIELVSRQNLRLAVKMPDLLEGLDLLETALEAVSLVVSVRNGIDVVRSTIQKGWLSPKGLRDDSWPYIGQVDGLNIPHWLPVEYHSRWHSMSENSRACLMWAINSETAWNAIEKSKSANIVMVRYEDFVENPRETVDDISRQLNAEQTRHTSKWISQIKPSPNANGNQDGAVFDGVDKDIRDYFERINAVWGYNPAG